MISAMHRIERHGDEWHVDVFRQVGDKTRLTKIYVIGRNDGAGPRNIKTFRNEANREIAHVLLPKKFGDAMLAYVEMRGET